MTAALKILLVGQHRQTRRTRCRITLGNRDRIKTGADDAHTRRRLLHLGNHRRATNSDARLQRLHKPARRIITRADIGDQRIHIDPLPLRRDLQPLVRENIIQNRRHRLHLPEPLRTSGNPFQLRRRLPLAHNRAGARNAVGKIRDLARHIKKSLPH